jgi:hypothetical protein
MITIRNPTECQSLTVIADAQLVVGQLVKLIQAAASGDPCEVASPQVADYKDATLEKGIVYFVKDDDEAVDYIVDPNDGSLTVNTGADGTRVIPAGAACSFWFDKPIIAYTAADFTADAGATIAVTTREGAKIAFNTSDHLLDTYDAADVDGSDVYQGVVYRNDGAELTVYFSKL